MTHEFQSDDETGAAVVYNLSRDTSAEAMRSILTADVAPVEWDRVSTSIRTAIDILLRDSSREILADKAIKGAKSSADSELGEIAMEAMLSGKPLLLSRLVFLHEALREAHVSERQIGRVPSKEELEKVVQLLTQNWFAFEQFSLQQRGGGGALISGGSGRSRGTGPGLRVGLESTSGAVMGSVRSGLHASGSTSSASLKISGPSSTVDPQGFAIGMLLLLRENSTETGTQLNPALAWVPCSQHIRLFKPGDVKLFTLKGAIKKFMNESPLVATSLH